MHSSKLTLLLRTIVSQTEQVDYLSRGVIFNEETRILLAEKFINVEFLLPLPTYNFTSRDEIQKMLEKLKKMWENPSIMCPLDSNTHFNTPTGAFNFDWLLVKISQEVEEATHEAEQIRSESAAFSYQERKTRLKRCAPVAAPVIAGIGFFGGGILLGGGDCGLTGLFNLCQKHGRENAANIDRLNQYASVLTDYVLEVESASNEKSFCLITNELEEIQKTQTEMQNNQNQN